MRVVCISDTHGFHRKVDVPDGDLLLHAGDITNVGELGILEDFNHWIGELPHPHKVVIAGNHDFCFEREAKKARALCANFTYLEDESVSIGGFKIFGSPQTPRFGDWAFMYSPGDPFRWANIPRDVGILLTHGPSFGYLDKTIFSESVGCPELGAEITKLPGLKLHAFGHIHEARGASKRGGVVQVVNASICDQRYKPTNEPIVVDL